LEFAGEFFPFGIYILTL